MGDEDERERRQLDLMSDRLARFRAGELGIGPVINDLEALRWELHSADEGWIERFIEAWSDLEIPYAVALDRLGPIPTIADGVVAEGVSELERLVAEVTFPRLPGRLMCGDDVPAGRSPGACTTPARVPSTSGRARSVA